MPKRLTRAEIERIREEVKAWHHAGERGSAPATIRMKLSYGHEEDETLGLDPNKAICSQCRAKSMRSAQQ